MRSTRRFSLRWFLSASCLLLACGDDARVPAADQERVGGFAAYDVEGAPAAAMAMSKAAEPAATFDAGALQTGAPSDSVVRMPSMVIRNGSAVIRVDSLEPAMLAVQQMASRLGGYVGNTSLTADWRQMRSATLE